MKNLLINNLLIYDKKNKLINVINSNNLSFNYVDTINKKVVVGLLNNSKEEQERFKKLVVDSEYIVFIEGGKLIDNSN